MLRRPRGRGAPRFPAAGLLLHFPLRRASIVFAACDSRTTAFVSGAQQVPEGIFYFGMRQRALF